MTFLSPWFLLLAAAVVPVAIAFLFRTRRDLVRVSSTVLYRRIATRRARSHRLRQLLRLLALLACIGAVIALALGAARPAPRSAGTTTGIVVDVSASMGEGGGGAPIDGARSLVRGILDRRGPADRVAIVAAGARPRTLSGPTDDGAVLDAAASSLTIERGEADLGAAIELASALVADRPGARVIVLHDGGAAAGDPPGSSGVPITQHRVPRSIRDNVGITAFAARPPADARSDEEREVLVAVASSSRRSRRVEVVLEADGIAIARRTVDVPRGEEVDVRFALHAPVAALVARIAPADDIGDALAADDEARLLRVGRTPPRVLLVAAEDDEAGAFFAEQAIRAAGARDVEIVDPLAASLTIGPDEIAVVLGVAPPHRLPVPTLFVATREGALPVRMRGPIPRDQTGLRSVATDSPVLRGVAFDGLTIEEAVAVEVPDGGQALVDLDGGTVVAAGGTGRQSWVYAGVDPESSDLVLRVAFPVLVANALAVLGGATDVAVADTLPRSEVALREADRAAWGTTAPVPASFSTLPLSPPALLGALAALLLAVELLAWRRRWAW